MPSLAMPPGKQTNDLEQNKHLILDVRQVYQQQAKANQQSRGSLDTIRNSRGQLTQSKEINADIANLEYNDVAELAHQDKVKNKYQVHHGSDSKNDQMNSAGKHVANLSNK